MEIKSYIGASRPLSLRNYDKRYLDIIESNLNYFNKGKQKGILTVEHYISEGDQWQILLDGHLLLCDMTLNAVLYTTLGIMRYAREMNRKKGE